MRSTIDHDDGNDFQPLKLTANPAEPALDWARRVAAEHLEQRLAANPHLSSILAAIDGATFKGR